VDPVRSLFAIARGHRDRLGECTVAGIDTPAGYTGLQRIGAGSEADVYRAWDERAHDQVVVRLYRRFARGRAEEAVFAEFCATAVSLGRHPAIVGVRAGGITATGRPWLALEEVEAVTLEQVLREAAPSPAEAIDLAVTVADALTWAHAAEPAMTHGRLRAEHVLITADGSPMLHDFALTKTALPRDDMTAVSELLFRALTGTPWPGVDDRIIRYWPGLTQLFDETLTPAPALDDMATFADRLRQIRLAAGAMIPLPAPVAALPDLEDQEPDVRGRHRLATTLRRWLRRKSEIAGVADPVVPSIRPRLLMNSSGECDSL
jgi:hypothetical protein